MTPRRSRLRRGLLVAGGLLLAVNSVAFATLTWPRLSSVRRAENRAMEVTARKAALESVWAQFTARKEVVARNRDDIATLRRDLLKDRAKDLFAAQREVETLARESGLRTRRSTYTMEDIRGTGLVRCLIDLPLDGTYRELTSFLARIETAKRFIVVDQMSLSRNEEGAKMNLKLSAVFKEEDAGDAR